jgi:hypothetical protein
MASRLRYIIDAQDKTKSATSGAAKNIEGLEKTVKDVGAAITAMGAVAAAKAAFELGQLGAQSIRTRNAFIAISGGADEATARMDAMQTATRGALSEQEAMAAANRLMQMGLASNAQELGNVTEMAVRLGTAMGRDASASIEEFALLLANQSIPRLDTFGISAGKVRTRIAELQDATEGLTREEAFLQAVQEEGAVAMERLGEATEDEALAFERAEAMAKDFRAELGERLAPTIADVLETGMLLLTWNEQIAEATAEHAAQIETSTESYTDYEAELRRAAEAAGLVVDENGNLMRVTQGMGSQIEQLVQENYLLSESEFQAARDAEDLQNSLRGAEADAARLTAAADVTSESLGELSTSARTVASSFGDMTYDPAQLWDMALASGASVEALGALAEHLGIATDAEIQHTMDAYRLVEAFGAGKISAEELEAGFTNLGRAEEEAYFATEAMAGELRDLHKDAGDMRAPLDEVSGGLRGVEGAARAAQAALAAIERQVNINIDYKVGERPGLQHGTDYFQGGVAMVGEGGPELVALPRGSRVFPSYSPVTRQAISNRFEGDRVYINDRMAAAMYLDQRRRQRVARLEARM